MSGREPRAVEMTAIGNRLAALLEHSLVSDEPVAHQIPGSAEVLSLLTHSSDFAVALATGGLRISADLKLNRAGLSFSDMPFASSDDEASREHILRTAAERAAKKHGPQFASITYVGDGVWDVRAARELGWRFIGIAAGEQAERLPEAGASLIVPNYRPAEAFFGAFARRRPAII